MTTGLMSEEDIKEEVLSFIKSLVQANKDSVTSASRVLSEQLVDSLAVIQLVGFIESKFNIKMEQADLTVDNLDSADRITNYLLEKKA